MSSDEEARERFEYFDSDNNGEIDLPEFRKLVRALGLELERDEAEERFAAIDADENGLIDFAEFSIWWSERD
jgi:calmodulin